MGPYRTAAALSLMLALPAQALEPGWHYSPLPGEGDRAALGCDREATDQDFTCIAVRCEDDFTIGLYLHTSRQPVAGLWEMTLDRENAGFTVEAAMPYGGRFVTDTTFLRDRIAQGTFIYLRHAADTDGSYAYIDLSGSLYAINRALAWCAPRVEPKAEPGV